MIANIYKKQKGCIDSEINIVKKINSIKCGITIDGDMFEDDEPEPEPIEPVKPKRKYTRKVKPIELVIEPEEIEFECWNCKYSTTDECDVLQFDDVYECMACCDNRMTKEQEEEEEAALQPEEEPELEVEDLISSFREKLKITKQQKIEKSRVALSKLEKEYDQIDNGLFDKKQKVKQVKRNLVGEEVRNGVKIFTPLSSVCINGSTKRNAPIQVKRDYTKILTDRDLIKHESFSKGKPKDCWLLMYRTASNDFQLMETDRECIKTEFFCKKNKGEHNIGEEIKIGYIFDTPNKLIVAHNSLFAPEKVQKETLVSVKVQRYNGGYEWVSITGIVEEPEGSE